MSTEAMKLALAALRRVKGAYEDVDDADPPKTQAEFILGMLVAAGHVTQEKVDEAYAIADKMPRAPAEQSEHPEPAGWRYRFGPNEDWTLSYTQTPWLDRKRPGFEEETLYTALHAEQRKPLSDDQIKDAARYRWLRDIGSSTWVPFKSLWHFSPANCDAAIDSEMSLQAAHGIKP
jgi:hypothetical protein